MAMALLVLFCLSVVIGAVQFLTVDTYRQTRLILESDDSFARAEGLVALLISRYKREFRYEADTPLNSDPSGSEDGTWDSKDFVMGWERQRMATRPPAHRMSLWIRFVDDRPIRTHRFDLVLRPPTMLHPRVAFVERVASDDVDPENPSARQTAFADLALDATTVSEREGLVEAATIRIRDVIDGTPAEILAAADPAALTGLSTPLGEMLADRMEYQALTRLEDRLTRARQVLTAARALDEGTESRWEQACAFELAAEIVRQAESLTPPERRTRFQEALSLLDEILAASPESCGASLVAWNRAHLSIRLRANWKSPTSLAATKAAALTQLRATTDRDPKSPIHRGTDIRREELPVMLDLLWLPRVAVTVQANNGDFLLTSFLADGSKPVVHLESASPVRPFAWHADGSQIYAAAGDIGAPPSFWRLDMNGARIEDLFTEPLPRAESGRPDTSWSDLIHLKENAEGTAFMVSGLGIETGPSPRMPYLYIAAKDDEMVAYPKFLVGGSSVVDFAFAPTGDQMAILAEYIPGPSSGQIGYEVAILDDILDPNTRTEVIREKFPNPFHAGNLAWGKINGKEWIVFMHLMRAPEDSQIMFVDPAAPAGSRVTQVPFSWTQAPSLNPDWWYQRGRLVEDPPGYMISDSSRIQYIPMPGSGEVAASWPSNIPEGTLSDIRHIDAPSWGQFCFFSARSSGGKETLYSLNLEDGQATALAGPGGGFPSAQWAQFPAVSPVPDAP